MAGETAGASSPQVPQGSAMPQLSESPSLKSGQLKSMLDGAGTPGPALTLKASAQR
jgi:hypothetical protein